MQRGTRVYTNHWAVKIAGGFPEANRIASKYGFINIGQIGALKDYYHFHHSRTIKRSVLSSRGAHSFISMEPKSSVFTSSSDKNQQWLDFYGSALAIPVEQEPRVIRTSHQWMKTGTRYLENALNSSKSSVGLSLMVNSEDVDWWSRGILEDSLGLGYLL
ncbi:hypothetical protein CB1_001144027 [Camelus ferus]|nr:hypothetical protein CB1_001144027 [Camelus ferus]